MHRWIRSFVVISTVFVTLRASSAPAPVQVATCGDSKIEVVGAPDGVGEVRALVVAPGGDRWSFTAITSLVRLGTNTRTIMTEDIRTVQRKPPHDKDVVPSGLAIDFLLDEKKVILRHASEGGSDPGYAVDLDQCRFGGDAVLASLLPPPTEAPGCDPAAVHGRYRTQVDRAAKLADADADLAAKALCEDHQRTIEARSRLEQTISDRAAYNRIAARGVALMRIEQNRIRAWNRIDGCLGAHASKAHGVAALHDSEAKTRACYDQIAAKR